MRFQVCVGVWHWHLQSSLNSFLTHMLWLVFGGIPDRDPLQVPRVKCFLCYSDLQMLTSWNPWIFSCLNSWSPADSIWVPLLTPYLGNFFKDWSWDAHCWSNGTTHLVCLLSLRDHCALLPDVESLGNYGLI